MGILNHTRGGNSPNLVLERGGGGGQDIIILLEGEGVNYCYLQHRNIGLFPYCTYFPIYSTPIRKYTHTHTFPPHGGHGTAKIFIRNFKKKFCTV